MGATNITISRIAVINFKALRGDTFISPQISFKINGQPEDFTGCTFIMQMRNASDAIAVTLTNSAGIAVAGNTIQLTISATALAPLPAAEYYYDVQKTKNGIVETIMGGSILLVKDITT